MELVWTDDEVEPVLGSGAASASAANAAAKPPTKERQYTDADLVAGLRHAMGQVAAGGKPSSGETIAKSLSPRRWDARYDP